MWNVHGITDTNKDCLDFVNIIANNDIVFLFETWTNRNSNIDIDGYVSHNFYRKYQNRRARRCSGGVTVYIKDILKNGVSIVRNSNDTVIWLKLDKVFFPYAKRYLYLWYVYLARIVTYV